MTGYDKQDRYCYDEDISHTSSGQKTNQSFNHYLKYDVNDLITQ